MLETVPINPARRVAFVGPATFTKCPAGSPKQKPRRVAAATISTAYKLKRQ